MIGVGVSGAGGRLGSAIAAGVADAPDLELRGLYNPGRAGESVSGLTITEDAMGVICEVMVEVTKPDVVMANLSSWRQRGLHAVVGTSGFTAERMNELRDLWGDDGPGCIVVPNFSIGAALMMRFAELAAPHFHLAEVVERHHADKPDAPSGTALSTAERIAKAGGRSSQESSEIVSGARGGSVEGVLVHSLRLDAVLSHQEVAMSNPGELLSLTHQSTSYASFVGGALMAIRHVVTTTGVSVGLDHILGGL